MCTIQSQDSAEFGLSLAPAGAEAPGKGNFESLLKLLWTMEETSSPRTVSRAYCVVPDSKVELTG